MKKNKGKTSNWQTLIAVLLFIVGIAGFLWVFLPPVPDAITLQLQEIRVPVGTETYALLQDSYQIVIENPKAAKAGKQFGYTFELQQSEIPINVTFQDVDLYKYYQLNLRLEPAFENTTINPPGSMITSLLPDQEPSMVWKMEPTGVDPIQGIFWVYLDFIPLEEGIEPSSTALLARKVEIPVQTILGLDTDTVTIISTMFTVAAIFFGLPQFTSFKGEPDDRKKK